MALTLNKLKALWCGKKHRVVSDILRTFDSD